MSSDILLLRHRSREFLSSFIRACSIILQFCAGVVQVYNTYIVFIIRFRFYDRQRMSRTVSSALTTLSRSRTNITANHRAYGNWRVSIYKILLRHDANNKEKFLSPREISPREYLFLPRISELISVAGTDNRRGNAKREIYFRLSLRIDGQSSIVLFWHREQSRWWKGAKLRGGGGELALIVPAHIRACLI